MTLITLSLKHLNSFTKYRYVNEIFRESKYKYPDKNIESSISRYKVKIFAIAHELQKRFPTKLVH